MNKKVYIGLGILIFALSISSILIIFSSSNSKNEKTVSPISEKKTETLSKPILSEKTKDYIDSSGFKFSYPIELKMKQKENLDNNTFSQLELTSSNTSGSLSIEVITSNFKTVNDWIKNNKKISSNTVVKKVKLADLEANQFSLDNQLNTVAIDQGVLFKITTSVKENADFWQKVNQTIISTFAFTQPVQNTDSSDEGVTFEGEEVVE